MRALAEFLSDAGWQVYGTDLFVDEIEAWAKAFHIQLTACAESEYELSVHSAAVASNELGDASIAYPKMLAMLSQAMPTVAVAGTHGKSTTATILSVCLDDSSRVVGAIAKHDRRSGRFNCKSNWPLVVEACEFRSHFLELRPEAICVLDVEWDHPDWFQNESHVCDAFSAFINQHSGDGPLVVSTQAAKKLCLPASTVTFASNVGGDYWPRKPVRTYAGCAFELMFRDRCIASLEIAALPLNQVANAVAAAATALELGVSAADLQLRLARFGGMERRFDVVESGETIFVDDYAHHPTAVANVLAELRSRWPEHRLVAVFEPHQAGRLRAFPKEFSEALRPADAVALAPVFAARELPSSEDARLPIFQALGEAAVLCDSLDRVSEWIDTQLANDQKSVIALMGAGKIGRILDERIKKR